MNEVQQTNPLNHYFPRFNSPSCTLTRKIDQLRKLIFPLTKLFFDRLGNSLQIWSVPESRSMAILQHQDGSTRIITSDKIHNPLSPSDNAVTLHNRLLVAPDCKWNFAIKEDGSLDIWPNLEAQGWREAIPRDNQDLSGVARLARGKSREEMCDWFYRNGFQMEPSARHQTPKVEIHLRSGENLGTYRADDHETIRNLLRQGGRINAVHHDATQEVEVSKGFIGRGLCFIHPRDKSHSTFNVDYTKDQKKNDNTWGVEDKHGYHIDVRSDRVKGKVRAGTKETYIANYEARKNGQKVLYEIYIPPVRSRISSNHPGNKQFEKTLQQTNLTNSYNSSNPNNPASDKGFVAKDIGGVACSSDYIGGLFDSPESLFEEEHFFYLQTADGKQPFTNEELRQIIRELAIGIYVHGTIPFFSLHFRQGSADLFPVIHPAYENTLVGRVISMLDYFMKGYLNGGVFTEGFIDGWYKNPDWKAQERTAFQELIDFEQYCSQLEGANQNYISLRSLTAGLSSKGILGKMLERLLKANDAPESEALTEFEGFRNSFRIIAKQNGFKKAGNVFVIDADFDVEYTIEPSPKYEEELRNHERKYGKAPDSYSQLVGAFEFMKQLIHDHMKEIPLCKNYFSMLGIIHFLSSYLSTLKQHRKIPSLEPMEITNRKGCPPLFPHLPITIHDKEALRVNIKDVTCRISSSNYRLFQNYLLDQVDHLIANKTQDTFHSQKTPEILKLLQEEVEQNILSNCSSRFRAFIEKNKQALGLNSQCITISNQILSMLGDLFNGLMPEYRKISAKKDFSKWDFVENVLDNLDRMLVNQLVEITSPIPYKSTMINSQLKENELEKNKRIVGGCGLRLEKKSAEASKEAEIILQNYWHTLPKLETEKWERVDLPGAKGTLFGLKFGDLPYDSPDDYAWMEQFLFSSPEDQNFSRMETMVSIQEAMQAKEKKTFEELIKKTKSEELAKMRDYQGASLLCYAAMVPDTYYFKTLLGSISPLLADNHGYLPTHYAAMKDNVGALELLHSSNVSLITTPSKNGATPLSVAILHGAKSAVSFCLQKNVKLVLLADGYSDLHCALHVGNKEVISLLLANKTLVSPWINVCSEEGGTPLMLSCELKDSQITEKLLDLDAKADMQRRDGVTAIEIACKRNCLPVLSVLLAKTKPTPLAVETALKESSAEVVAAIAEQDNKAFADFRNSFKDNPAHIAVGQGNLPVAFYLANVFPQMFEIENADKKTPLQMALTLNAWDIIGVLQKSPHLDPESLLGANNHPLKEKLLEGINLEQFPKNDVNIPLALAKYDALLLFMQTFEDFSLLDKPLKQAGGKTLAYVAAENQSKKVLHFLLELIKGHKASLEKHFQDRHLFYPILETGDKRMVELAFQVFPNQVDVALDNQGTKSLHIAAKFGHLDVLKLLISKGVDVNLLNKHGHSPLHEAIRSRHEASVRFLMENQAIISADDLLEAATQDDLILEILTKTKPSQKHLDEAVFKAIQNFDEKAVERLRTQGASFNYVHSGWTPLLLASFSGQRGLLANIIQELTAKAPQHLQDVNSDGNNALHLACLQGHLECVSLLLQAGFDKNQPNSQKKTPQDLAGNKKGLSTLFKSVQKSLEERKFFQEALFRGNPQEIESFFKLFSLHETLSFGNSNELVLQLALRHSRELTREQALKWIEAYCKSYLNDLPRSQYSLPKEISFQNPKEETLSETLIKQGISPFDIPPLDLNALNGAGETLLHVAAESHEVGENLFQEILEKDKRVHAIDKAGKIPLFAAVEGENDQKIKLLIEQGSDVDHYDKELFTPLGRAIQKGTLSAVKLLIQAGATINKSLTKAKITPLLFSMGAKQVKITRYLLLQGASSQLSLEQNVLPIHLAAEMGNRELFQLVSMDRRVLLAKGPHGKQAIHFAALHGHTDILAYINQLEKQMLHTPLTIPQNAEANEEIPDFLEEATPLHLAALSGNVTATSWLLNHAANPESVTRDKKLPVLFGVQSQAAHLMLQVFDPYKVTHETDLQLSMTVGSIRHDHVDAMKMLYEKGIPSNWPLLRKSTGLHLASHFGALKCTAWLLQQEANPLLLDDDEKTAYEIAASKQFHEQFKLLLLHGCPDLDEHYSHEQTLLHIAARTGQLKNAIILVRLGASLNCTDFMDYTPLHWAVAEGHVDVAAFLLALGADSSIKAKSGKTPKDLAASESMKQLFSNFEKVLKESEENDSRLHLAVRMGNLCAVLALCEEEDVNTKNASGSMPLHLAVGNEQTQIALALLQNGADPHAENDKKQTPLILAQQKDPLKKGALFAMLGRD